MTSCEFGKEYEETEGRVKCIEGSRFSWLPVRSVRHEVTEGRIKVCREGSRGFL